MNEELNLDKPVDLIATTSIDKMKRCAKRAMKRLSPEKTVKLQRFHLIVGKCLGLNTSDVFRGAIAPIPVIPRDLSDEEKMVYQRNREIKVLSTELPETPIEEIESLVSAWKLVIWVGSDDAKDRQEQSDVDTSAPSPAGRGLSSSAASFWSHVTVPVLTDEEDLRLRRLVRSRAQEIFMPPAIAFAEQKAEALSSIAQGVSVAFACELISRIYGFTDWQNMVSQFVPASRSKFDEEVALDLQLSRRTWQISVIQQAFEVEKWLATDLHSLWLPSSHKMSYESTAKWTRDSTVSSSAPSRVVRKSGTLCLGKHGTDPSQDDGGSSLRGRETVGRAQN